LASFDSPLEIISSRSPVPSEKFAPRYKENGRAAPLSDYGFPEYRRWGL
jgi:hypothetical protein